MALPRGTNFAPTRITLRREGGGIAPPVPAAAAQAAAAAPPRTARRETQIDDDITNLKEEKRLYSQSVDLPSVNANTTANHDITTASRTCETGDYVEFIGGEINHGYIPVGCLPCPADDIIRLRVANVTAGAINPAATTLYFVIHKFVSTQ